MELARYGQGGQLVTPEEFMAQAGPDYKSKGIFPYCRECGEQVDVYGVNATAVTSRFDHKNRPKEADPYDECSLANRTDARYQGLQPSGWNPILGAELRKEFFEDENLKRAYAFCLNLCRKGNLPAALFGKLIERADRRAVWSYAGIELWCIPYVLLTLGQFHDQKGQYDYHFVFRKPRGSAEVLWLSPEQCQLRKVFSSNGEDVRTQDNPYPLSEGAFLAKAGETGWINNQLLTSLKRHG